MPLTSLMLRAPVLPFAALALAAIVSLSVLPASALSQNATGTIDGRAGRELGLWEIEVGPIPGFAPFFDRAMDRVMEEAIARRVTPGAAVVIGHGGEVVFSGMYGRVDWDPDSAPVTETSVYDLASVTKVAATTLAVMILTEDGRIDVDAPVHRYLRAWPNEGEASRVTVRHLLSHRSGLPAGAPFWQEGDDRNVQVYALSRLARHAPPGEGEVYTDLGPILLGFVVEEVAGEPLDAFLERRVYRPLGLRETTFHPLEDGFAPESLAPTEWLGRRQLRGVVHDPSARALGGVAGNAGLFSSARDLAVLASAVLWEKPTRLVCRDVLRDFTARQDPSGRYALGWETPGERTFWSEVMGSRAFGHTGFTGTSVWIDPEADYFVVLLTNRVNPSAENQLHQWLRREVHDLVRRGHLAQEADQIALDWRVPETWRSVDSCRAELGGAILGRLEGAFLAWMTGR
ncbi:MAG TPA: serine hydrolase domain-containing protein [Longimicrobiales bacterium]